MHRLLKLASFWVFILLVVVLLLQLSPLTGIYLMFLGGLFWGGILLLAFLLVLTIEAMMGRVPRFLVFVPALFFGGYYTLYFHQGLEVYEREAKLKASNPGQLMQFDPAKHDLVMKYADSFVQTYRVPVVYSPNKNYQPEGHIAHRMLLGSIVRTIPKDSRSRVSSIAVLGPLITGAKHSRRRRMLKKPLSILRFPEAPQKASITVHLTELRRWKPKANIEEAVYRLSFEGKLLGEFRTASVLRYSPIPLPIVGCGANSAVTRWECFMQWHKHWIALYTAPDGADPEAGLNPIALLLGIKRYNPKDLDNYEGYDEHISALKRVRGEAKRVETEVFKQLAAMMKDDGMMMPWSLAYSLARNPERLTPLAGQLVDYFERLLHADYRDVKDLQSKRRAIATALAALSREAYAPHANRIFTAYSSALESLRAQHKRIGVFPNLEIYPSLYVRMAEVGVVSGPFYQQELLKNRVLGWLRFAPVLALCRVGSANEKTVAFLKAEYARGEQSATRDNHYNQALFITLLRLGERAFAEEHLPGPKIVDGKWLQSVLASGDDRPNNCMVRRWPGTSYLPEYMAPTVPK